MPPVTRQDNITETLHGVKITDPYRWLEDQESGETRAWLEAQIGYTRATLDALPGRDALHRRLAELMRVEALDVPFERGGSYFLGRRDADQEQKRLYRRTTLDGADELLVDPYAIGQDHKTSVFFCDVSADGSLICYGIRQGGEDEVEVRLMDANTRADLADRLPKQRLFSPVLTPDKTRLFYSISTEEGPRVRCHRIGTNPAEDVTLFGEGYDGGKIAWCALSEDGHWLLIHLSHGSAAPQVEVYIKDLNSDGPLTPLVNDLEANFEAEFGGSQLYLLTDWEAPNKRVLRVDLNRWIQSPNRNQWHEIIAEGPDVIEAIALAGGKLFVTTLHDATSCIREYPADGALNAAGLEVPLPGLGSADGPYGRWESTEAFVTFSSFATPQRIYRLDIETGAIREWARLQAPIDPDAFTVEQVFYPSKDGTKIPMFLVYKKGLERDGGRPTLLYGYGGFRASLTPGYNTSAIVLAEQGGLYAVANLRGGGEYGEAWHQAGMRDKKQNVFDDYIAAAEWLIANGHTNPDKLAIYGGSNGGLLVGAALTQRPELFRAVVCGVPLLDMIRYHQFLVAAYWVPEYGSADAPEPFTWLHAYSPYHRVQSGTRYPSVLFMTGDADTRVAPLHARKMAALLQASTASDPAERPILLHYDTSAGHSGGKPLSRQIDDSADLLSYLFHQLGVTEGAV